MAMKSISSQTAEFEEVRPAIAFSDRLVRLIQVVRKASLALRVAGWLCVLPVLIKIYSLPGLLERLCHRGRGNRDNSQNVLPLTLALAHSHKRREKSHSKGDEVYKKTSEMEKAVRIVLRVCNLRIFRLPIFPRPCLRRSLALYRTLNDMGYPVEFHLGVRKKAGKILAHSWLTFEGSPVFEKAGNDSFKVVFSHPTTTNSSGGKYERKRTSAAAG